MASASFVLVTIIEGVNSTLFSQIKCLQPSSTFASLRDETFQESGIVVEGGASAVRVFIVPEDSSISHQLDISCLELSVVELVSKFKASEIRFKIVRRVLVGAPPMGSEAAKEVVATRNAFTVLCSRDPAHSLPDPFQQPKTGIEEMFNDMLKVFALRSLSNIVVMHDYVLLTDFERSKLWLETR